MQKIWECDCISLCTYAYYAYLEFKCYNNSNSKQKVEISLGNENFTNKYISITEHKINVNDIYNT